MSDARPDAFDLRRSEYIERLMPADMVNCMLNLKHATLELMVGPYARKLGPFSPLVEQDGAPVYTKLEGVDAPPSWPEHAVPGVA